MVSPIATMWRQVNTLIAMDNYVYSAYQKRRMPRGVMVIKSSNLETVERTTRNIQEHLERDRITFQLLVLKLNQVVVVMSMSV